METINGDLLIKGNLICGDDGILEVTGDVTWRFDLAPEGESKERAREAFKDIPEGDFVLAGRQVLVKGNCWVWGNIIYDWKTYKGHITAGYEK